MKIFYSYFNTKKVKLLIKTDLLKIFEMMLFKYFKLKFLVFFY